jgi:DNA-binding response OmpR family regulator
MPRIVVVDDDPTNTTLVKMLLELEGFAVEACSDLDAARASTDESTDAFLIDYHLARGIKGLDLVREIRDGETAASRDVVVIVASGDIRRDSAAREAGADLFLLKPYKPETLFRRLNELLTSKG